VCFKVAVRLFEGWFDMALGKKAGTRRVSTENYWRILRQE